MNHVVGHLESFGWVILDLPNREYIDGTKALLTAKFADSEESQDISRGSEKHKLGFLYTPKKMNETELTHMRPIPLKMGQALVFFLSTVHGSIVNRSKVTRWSSDIRIMNSLAPVNLATRPSYYETATETCVTRKAKEYILANKQSG